MISIIKRTKVCLWLAVAVLTVAFAFISFRLHSNDIRVRLNPQVERAVVLASRLLPQLEESEAALRGISSDLEKSRERILRKYGGLSDGQTGSEGESVESVISETISWMNRITKLCIGRRGHVIVVSKDDLTILAHPDERFVGERLHPLWSSLNRETVPDLKALGEKIKRNDFHEEFFLFFPDAFFLRDPDTDSYYAAVDACLYGSVFSYEDTYIICGVALYEVLSFVVFRCFFSTLFFFVFVWVFVRYIGFVLDRHTEEPTRFRNKLVSYGAISLIALFFIFWYYQTIMDVTWNIAAMDEYAMVAVDNLTTYNQYSDRLSEWLDEQYLEKCRLAADQVQKKGKNNLKRSDMVQLARDLDVEAVFVYGQNGKVLVTNSPYDHLALSNDKTAPSYAFRQLLDGKEYVIQDVQPDEFGEKKQLIGVSIRDDNDLCDGFVQIAVRPELREQLLNPINIHSVLENLVIGIPRYALAVDKNAMKIVETTGWGYEDIGIEDLGIDAEKIKEKYNGVLMIAGETYYIGVSESDNLYLLPMMKNVDNSNALKISCVLGLLSIAAYVLLVVCSNTWYRRVALAGKAEQTEAAGTQTETCASENKKKHWWDDLWGGLPKTEEKSGFENRWKDQSTVPLEEQTPEMRIGGICFRLLLVFSVLFLIFETSMIYVKMLQGAGLDGFSYVLLGNWEKGVNLFSFSYCLFLLCILYVFQEFLNQALYRIARTSDLKQETILLLLRSTLKYSCALIFLYIGLAKFGIDTRALWASAGVLSLMVGFGAKDLIADIISGLFIIFEGTYKIGDWVAVGNWRGTVKEIGLRYTKVEYNGDTKFLNNSSVRDLVRAEGSVVREMVKVSIPYEMDILEIEKLLERELPVIGQKISGIVEPPKYQGVMDFEEGCVKIRFSVKCLTSDRMKVRRAFLREIKILFDRKHINIPYTHVVFRDYKDVVNTYIDTPDETPEGED